jgi:ATP-dependent helicase/nuclease subunit B
MAVTFVIGRAGAGKTKWCLDRIVEAIRKDPLGPPVYWILPRQATFIAQRQLAAATGLGGYFRARVISLEELGEEILAECGGIARPEITDRGRRMILGHLLRGLGGKLKFFGSVANQPGVAAELDATLGELERAGQDADEIQNQIASSAATTALRAKIHDLALIYSEYRKFLGQDRLDPKRRLDEALKAIGDCKSLRESEVFIDSFYDFTGSERKVVAALAGVCKSLAVTFTMDPKSEILKNLHHLPDEMSLFYRSEMALRQLRLALTEAQVEIAESVLLGKSNTDAKVETHLVKAPDRQAEVDAAARWIRKLVSGGMRFRDIVVLMRSAEEYHHILQASFAEHQIPFFMDERRTASHHPLVRLIRAALAVASTNWSHDAMMGVIKTALVGLEAEEADGLENYVLRHGIDHSVWATERNWTGRRRDEDDPVAIDEAAKMDAIRRRVVDRLGPFVAAVRKQGAAVRDFAGAVFRLLEAFECPTKIVKWIDEATNAGQLEEAGEHERVWDETVTLFDELVDLLGSEVMPLKEFAAMLDSALEGFDLALTPPTVDQVLVGAVDRTRTPQVKACVVLGLSEGQFPRSAGEDSIFTDADRRNLGKHRIELNPDSSRRLLDENFLGYIARTRAREKLLLTRSVTDAAGREVAGSSLWLEAEGDAKAKSVPREDGLPLQLIATPRQLVGSLINWVKSGAGDGEWQPVYQWLAQYPSNDDAVDFARRSAWKALSYRNEAKIDVKRAAELFPSPLRADAYQLESFRMCPYQHFARYGLKLSERKTREFGRGDLSRVFREILQRLVRELIDSQKSWNDLDAASLERLTGQIREQLGEELMLSEARNRYLVDFVQRTVKLVAEAQKVAAGRGGFRPRLVNLRFGRDGDANPAVEIATPAGNRVELSGKIDRVDLLQDGSACAIDYRMRGSAINATEVYHGLCLRLMVNLLVLEKIGPGVIKDAKVTPSAAFCVQLLRPVRAGDPGEALSPEEPEFHLQVKPRGIFDLRVARELDRELTEGYSQVVQLYLKRDGGVGHPDKSDAATSQEFSTLLRHVEARIGQIADEIIGGRIDIRPYRIGTETPCPRCEFRALCRLEPAPGCYDDLKPIARPEMLARVMEEQGGER